METKYNENFRLESKIVSAYCMMTRLMNSAAIRGGHTDNVGTRSRSATGRSGEWRPTTPKQPSLVLLVDGGNDDDDDDDEDDDDEE